jgi:hypothetical protein
MADLGAVEKGLKKMSLKAINIEHDRVPTFLVLC